MSFNQYNKTTFPKEVLTEIFDFYKTHTKKETASKYNITCKILDRLLKENNIPHHRKTVFSDEEEIKICRLYQNHTSAYIGRLFHVKSSTVNSVLLQRGFSLHTEIENHYLAMEDRKKTSLKKYGVDNPNKSKIVRDKTNQTNLLKYGTICPSNTKESKAIQAKRNQEIITKRKMTCLERYGNSDYVNTKEYWKKRKETCLKKYGAEEWTKSDLFYQSFPGKFWCDAISFDSLPELAIYLYFVSHNLKIERPKITFKYFSIDGEHIYHPDFLIDNKLIEIKGDHFFKDGILINPYSAKEIDQIVAKDKWNCMNANNVEVWTKKNYIKYVDWFNSLKIDKEIFRDKKATSDIIRRKKDE